MGLIDKVKAELTDTFPDNVSVVVRGFSDDEHFSHNAFKKYRAASLIKVPLAIALFDGIENGMFDLHEAIAVTSVDAVYREEDQNGNVDRARIGDEFTVDYLLMEALAKSDNTATNMLIRYVGMDCVNVLLHEFGYVETVLARKMCDREAREKGKENYTNPSEITQMFRDLNTGAMLKPEHSQHLLGIMAQSKFHSKLTKYLPKSIDVPRKGGSLEPLGDQKSVAHDVGIVKIPYSPYVIGIFTEGFEKDEANEFIAQLSGRIYQTVVRE
ncbi:serine hydrolase [Candidatus Woesearchaeota archaeon]|nr:serine hydrolase [Candidatus Woesearchaeota archaeon]